MQSAGWLATALLGTKQPGSVRVYLLHDPKFKDTTLELVSDGVHYIKAEFQDCADTLKGCREKRRCVVLESYEVALVLSDTWAKSEMMLLVKDCNVGALELSTPAGLKSHKAITGVASLVRTAWQDLHQTRSSEQPHSWKGYTVQALPLSGLEDTFVPYYLEQGTLSHHRMKAKVSKEMKEGGKKGVRGVMTQQRVVAPMSEQGEQSGTRGAIAEQSGTRGAITEQSGTRGAIAEQSGTRGAIAEQSGTRGAIPEQSGTRGAIAEQSGTRGAIAEQSGTRGAIAEQSGTRGAIAEPVGTCSLVPLEQVTCAEPGHASSHAQVQSDETLGPHLTSDGTRGAGLTSDGTRGAGLTSERINARVNLTNLSAISKHTDQQSPSHNDVIGSVTSTHPVVIGNHFASMVMGAASMVTSAAPHRTLSNSSLSGYLMSHCEVVQQAPHTEHRGERPNDVLDSTDFAMSSTQQDAFEQVMELDDGYIMSPHTKDHLLALQDWVRTSPVPVAGSQTRPMIASGSFSSDALYSSSCCSVPESCFHLSIPTSGEEDIIPSHPPPSPLDHAPWHARDSPSKSTSGSHLHPVMGKVPCLYDCGYQGSGRVEYVPVNKWLSLPPPSPATPYTFFTQTVLLFLTSYTLTVTRHAHTVVRAHGAQGTAPVTEGGVSITE